MFWSLPSTSWPSSRARAATPPMKVPAMPKIWSFKISNLSKIAYCRTKRLPHGTNSPSPACGGRQGMGVALPLRRQKASSSALRAPSTRLAGRRKKSPDFVRRHDRLDDAGEHIVQRTHAVDHGQLALLAVVIDHRCGLVV